jgi:peptidoglycan lytic transglycosylase A
MRAKINRISAVAVLGLVLSPMVSAHATTAVILSPDKKLTAHFINFADLPKWRQDEHEKALAAFKRSCRAMARANQNKKHPGFMGSYADWAGVCYRASKVASDNRPAARSFFEHNFIPAQVVPGRKKTLFTGYYEPELAGSLKQSRAYNVPLYRKPADLRAGNQNFFTRAEIERGALDNRGLEFAYLKNPVDAFFLHIQGSGRLFLDNGRILRVGFAAKNGRPYTSIGKILIDQGMIARKDMSMQSIRNWLTNHPRKAMRIMRQNQSFIFFRPLKNTNPNLGPPGAQSVPLTPTRSLAVDKAFYAYGLPLWLETTVPASKPGQSIPFNRLMVAQDTGSAIKGAIRGDIFWGSGKAAGEVAGRMQQPGKLFLLLPRQLAAKYMR